jgi:hypothetical protein
VVFGHYGSKEFAGIDFGYLFDAIGGFFPFQAERDLLDLSTFFL